MFNLNRLRRPSARARRQTPTGGNSRVRSVRGHIERLEDRTVLSVSFGALPPSLDGADMAAHRPPPPIPFAEVDFVSSERLAQAHEPLQPASLSGLKPTDFRPVFDEPFEQPVVTSLAMKATFSQSAAVSSTETTASSSADRPADVFWALHEFAPPLPPDGGGMATNSGVNEAQRAQAFTTSPGSNDADDLGSPVPDAHQGQWLDRLDGRSGERQFVPPEFNPAIFAADIAWLPLYATAAGQTSAASSESGSGTVASLSVCDTVFEIYSMRPISLVWDIGPADQSTSYSSSDEILDDDISEGGFVELDASDLDDNLLPDDLVARAREAVDAVLADLDDELPQSTDAVANEQSDTPATAEIPPVPLPNGGDEGGLAAFAGEGGMVLLQPGGGEDQHNDYSLAAVYLTSPDKLLEVNVQMDASIGIYQAFDVAAGDARSADGRPVKLAEPLRTARPRRPAEDAPSQDTTEPAASGQAAWVTTLLVTAAPLARKRRSAGELHDWSCRR